MKWFRSHACSASSVLQSSQVGAGGGLYTIGLAALNQIMNIGATTGFAFSGRSENTKDFLLWQIIGSAFGLGTQLTFAGLVRVSSVQWQALSA